MSKWDGIPWISLTLDFSCSRFLFAPGLNTKKFYIQPSLIRMTLFSLYRSAQPNWEIDCVDILQCGNLAIFLPLWIYMKSIFADFRRLRIAVVTILSALNFDFQKNFTLENVQKFQNWWKFRVAQMVKTQFLTF